MRNSPFLRRPAVAGMLLGSFVATATLALAQEAPQPGSQLEEVVVTGSRIIQSVAQQAQPLTVIGQEAIENTGIASIGDILQQLTTGGTALNTKFNSSGNFGYPPNGGGIGAGSSQVDLRSLGSQRVLVLVDGIRWVNESSASGVSGSADLNTIPISIIDHIEVLEDGASAIYGSDAIAGVVNIITRKKFDGVEGSGYVGDYSKGGTTTEGSLTVGTSGEKFSGMFVASYFNQNAISSARWWQSSVPEPLAGLAAGSSATPQGRFTFCDPSRPVPAYGSCTPDQANFYDVTINNGTTTPVWNASDPSAGTYHDFSGADRFNYAPYNLLLTPSQRKSIFTSVTYAATPDFEFYLKGLFNNRQSENQAAPEPIFVGPYAGTGGIADTISVSRLDPYNPFGIDLDAASNFGWVTRRPLEAGPRIFTQDVDTWYFGTGFRGTLHLWRDYHWDINYVNSDNKADQTFTGGYNIGKVRIALGDPAICAQITGCVPLDLFGGQGRPITQAMLNYVLAPQLDSSEQTLKLVSANITGDLFPLGRNRTAGIAIGAEHRMYDGRFNPDPLRRTGESQDSFASPVAASYDVNEAYVEVSLPVLDRLGLSAAGRYSDYSTFGSTLTYKASFHWQPLDDLAVRGTASSGFRAPNLGELYGLTQFAATLVDPCGPTGGTINPIYVNGCRNQGVPAGFEQANTQITTFTGGNARLRPEKSHSYTGGIVYRFGWLEGRALTERLTIEATYYHHKIGGAIQARDIQALLNACLAAGGTDPRLCSPFTRIPGGNLNPPQNFLDNLGEITTDGEDLKISWISQPVPIGGHFSVALQATRVNNYKAVDIDGNVAQRQVGIEVNDSSIPRIRANAQLGWGIGDFDVSWILRYLDAVKENCGNAIISDVCTAASGGSDFHNLHSMLYNDVHGTWTNAAGVKNLSVELGVNNLFGENPPICFTCSLNGYDAGTYDLPGAFWNARVKYRF